MPPHKNFWRRRNFGWQKIFLTRASPAASNYREISERFTIFILVELRDSNFDKYFHRFLDKQYFTRVAKQSLLRIEHEEEGEICWLRSGNICYSWGFIDFSFNNTQCSLYWEKVNVLAKFCVLFLKYILYKLSWESHTRDLSWVWSWFLFIFFVPKILG